MLSEIFVQSTSGEVLIRKQYRYDLPQNTPEIFFKRLQDSKGCPLVPQIVDHAGHFYHIRRHNLYFVATTGAEVSPILVIELLIRIYHLLKDYCGIVNEDALHANMVLIYELLDEVMDYGYPQLTSTEKLKPYVQSQPILVRSARPVEAVSPGIFGIEHRSAPSNAANKPVIRPRWDQEMRKNEIFVDVIERLTVMLDPNGRVHRCEVNGHVTMKSFLVGCPDIKMGLNEDLTIGKEEGTKAYGGNAHLDECTFHDSVKLDDFSDSRMLTIRPPEGEFAVMRYKLGGQLPNSLPFRVYFYLRDVESTRDVEVGLKLCCDIPAQSHAVNVVLCLPLPKSTTGISQHLSGPNQSVEFQPTQKQLAWTIKKIPGKSEVSARFKLLLPAGTKTSTKDLGPAALSFEVSGFVTSNLQIRFLRVFDREHSYVPFRWIRYVSVTDSYIIKLS